MRRFVTSIPALAVLLACTLVLIATPAVLDRLAAAHTSARISLARQTLADDDILERIDRALTALAETANPGVVHIDVQSRGPGRNSGSGWVFDTDGHVVTNAHVVRGADRVRVQFANGRIESGRVIGIDAFTDIAVLKVDPFPGLFALPKAEEEIVRQGQRVYAFGSPFGFKFSMSEGIVSGLGRDPANASEFGGFTNFIQTDAAVNPGNSGGPLVDVRGRVVGMNVAIATGRDNDGTTEGDSAGISFAIPVATIESVVPQLVRTGVVNRGFLGLSFAQQIDTDVSPDGTLYSGIRVGNVVEGGPSAAAGVQPGDLVVSVSGQSIPRFNILRSIVGGSEPGTQVPLKVVREGQVLDLAVELGTMPDSVLAQGAGSSIMLRLGALIAGSDTGRTSEPPVIRRVLPDSLAASAGLTSGQRILSVDGVPVPSVDQFWVRLTSLGFLNGKRVTLVVEDEDGRETVELSLDR
jgi:serine protease Do